ncbi:MAG TPA: TIGR00159 family protein [Lachnospiraceae bacterium]|nr:TIGR00159 family protein [Lachnospiraceae bacterium]
MQDGMNPVKQFIGQINFSKLSIPSVRITDIIDIIVVSVILYYVFKWVRETRAWSLMRGLVMIGVISLFSARFHLYTVSWLIEKTFSVGIIALVIIFQPELRRALEQIGSGGISWVSQVMNSNSGSALSTDTNEKIRVACEAMSKDMVGALIVIDRFNALNDIINSSGIRVNGDVSSQILENIFIKNSALHDGAVIIRDNKIAAASCVLPVTQQEIGQKYGLRHRAAVGISENSEAVAIIVSEQTGEIALAHHGKLTKGLSGQQLKNHLDRLIIKPHTGKRFKKDKGVKKNA